VVGVSDQVLEHALPYSILVHRLNRRWVFFQSRQVTSGNSRTISIADGFDESAIIAGGLRRHLPVLPEAGLWFAPIDDRQVHVGSWASLV
jgi:hypothetical protein